MSWDTACARAKSEARSTGCTYYAFVDRDGRVHVESTLPEPAHIKFYRTYEPAAIVRRCA